LTRSHSVLQRLICLTLIGAFLCQELAYAAPISSSAIHHPQSAILFEAPLEFCSLKEIHEGQSNKPFIIHIQDAHANVSGQQNLASTLDQIMSKYGVSLVLSEGGSQDCSLTPIKKMAPPEVWKKIAKSYLMQGKITGEEYLNLTSNHPMKIMGLEDITLYLKSVQNYADLAGKREEILEYLKTIENSVQKLKQKLYPKELLDYEKNLSNKKELPSNYKALLELAQSKSIDLADLPNVMKLLELELQEKLIDFTLANLEQAAIVEELEVRGEREEVRGYLEKMGQMKDQRVSQFTHFQSLLNIVKEKNINISSYPNFMKYGEYLQEFSNLDLDQLLDELEKLEDRVYLAYLGLGANTVDARLVRSIDRYLKLLHVAYEIQMTTKEFNTFLVNEPDFSTPSYLAFLNRKLLDEGYYQDLVPYKNILEEGRKSLTGFYDSVSKRDEAFILNMEKTIKKESGKQRRSPLTAFLITGGYHTSHLKKLMQEKGYSYAVLTPIVTSETNQTNYEKQLLSPIKPEIKKVEVVQGEDHQDKPLSALEKDLMKARKKTEGVRAALLRAATGINPNISLTTEERQILLRFRESTTQNFHRFLEDTLRWENVPEDQISWRVEQILKELDQPFKETIERMNKEPFELTGVSPVLTQSVQRNLPEALRQRVQPVAARLAKQYDVIVSALQDPNHNWTVQEALNITDYLDEIGWEDHAHVYGILKAYTEGHQKIFREIENRFQLIDRLAGTQLADKFRGSLVFQSGAKKTMTWTELWKGYPLAMQNVETLIGNPSVLSDAHSHRNFRYSFVSLGVDLLPQMAIVLMEFVKTNPRSLQEKGVQNAVAYIYRRQLQQSVLMSHLKSYYAQGSSMIKIQDPSSEVKQLLRAISQWETPDGKKPFENVRLLFEKDEHFSPETYTSFPFILSIHELLKNAAEALPEREGASPQRTGAIRIKIGKSQNGAQIRVSNTSRSNAVIDKSKLFIPHLSSSSNLLIREHSGMQPYPISGDGVGLFMTKIAAELHGGSIEGPIQETGEDGLLMTTFVLSYPMLNMSQVNAARLAASEDTRSANHLGKSADLDVHTWLSLSEVAGKIETLKALPNDQKTAYRSQYSSLLDDPGQFSQIMQAIRGMARVDTAVWNQGGSVYQGGAELVANAIDAVLVARGAPPIGRFGVGFFMILASLKIFDDKDSRILLTTSTGKGKSRFVVFRRSPVDGNFEVGWGVAKKPQKKGTSVKIHLPSSTSEGKRKIEKYLQELETYLRKRFSQNRYLQIYLHSPDGKEELLNPLDGLHDLNGKVVKHQYKRARIDIDFFDDGFEVRDSGTGIDDQTLIEQLLVPRSPNKQMPSKVRADYQVTWMLREVEPTQRNFSRIGVLINGQGVMDFNAEGRNLPEGLFIELPPSSWVPESRNKISLSAEDVTTVINNVLQSALSLEQKIQILNAVVLVLKRIQAEISTDLLQAAINQLRPWLSTLEEKGYVILPNEAGFFQLNLGEKKALHLDPALFDFRPSKIPSAERVMNYESRDHALYLVDIQDPSLISFEIESAVFLNKSYYLPHHVMPAPIDLWIEAVRTGYREHATQERKGLLRPPTPDDLKAQERAKTREREVVGLAAKYPFVEALDANDQEAILRFIKHRDPEWRDRWLNRLSTLFDLNAKAGDSSPPSSLVWAATHSPLKKTAPTGHILREIPLGIGDERGGRILSLSMVEGTAYLSYSNQFQVENSGLLRIEGGSGQAENINIGNFEPIKLFANGNSLYIIARQKKESRKSVVLKLQNGQTVHVGDLPEEMFDQSLIFHEGKLYGVIRTTKINEKAERSDLGEQIVDTIVRINLDGSMATYTVFSNTHYKHHNDFDQHHLYSSDGQLYVHYTYGFTGHNLVMIQDDGTTVPVRFSSSYLESMHDFASVDGQVYYTALHSETEKEKKQRQIRESEEMDGMGKEEKMFLEHRMMGHRPNPVELLGVREEGGSWFINLPGYEKYSIGGLVAHEGSLYFQASYQEDEYEWSRQRMKKDRSTTEPTLQKPERPRVYVKVRPGESPYEILNLREGVYIPSGIKPVLHDGKLCIVYVKEKKLYFVEISPGLTDPPLGNVDFTREGAEFAQFVANNSRFFSKNDKELKRLAQRFFYEDLLGVEMEDLFRILPFLPDSLLEQLTSSTAELLHPFVSERSLFDLQRFFEIVEMAEPLIKKQKNLDEFLKRWIRLYETLETKKDALDTFFNSMKGKIETLKKSERWWGSNKALSEWLVKGIPPEDKDRADQGMVLYVHYLRGEAEELVMKSNRPPLAPEGRILARLSQSLPIAQLNVAYKALYRDDDKRKPGQKPSELEEVQSISQFEEKVKQFADSDLKPMEEKLASVIRGQDMSDHVATRELIQNARDAVREQYPKNPPPILVDTFIREDLKEFVFRVADQGGMDLGVIAGPLLVADVSSKIEKKMAGLFGQGFYTLFVDFDRVRIKTGDENRTFYIELVKGANGLPVINQLIETDEQFRGTTIEWARNYEVEPPELEALMLSQDLIRYAGAIQDVDIIFNGRRINEQMDVAAQAETEAGSVRVSLSPVSYHRRLTQDDLYIGLAEKWLFELLPPKFRLHLTRRGININIPGTVPVTRTRIGIALQELYQLPIQQAMAACGFKLAAQLYLQRGLLPPGLSEDFFSDTRITERTEPENRIQSSVIEDAKRINENRISEVNYEGYIVNSHDTEAVKERKIRDAADLVSLIEVEYGGARFNLWEYRREKIKEALGKKEPQGEMEVAKSLKDDLNAAAHNIVEREKEKKRPSIYFSEDEVSKSPVLGLLKMFYEKIVGVTEQTVSVRLFFHESSTNAFYRGGQIYFNLYDAFKTAEVLNQLMKETNSEKAFSFFREQLNLVIHELAHHGERREATHQADDIEMQEDDRPPHWIGEQEIEKLVGLFGWRVRRRLASYLDGKGRSSWITILTELKAHFAEGVTDTDLDELRQSIRERLSGSRLALQNSDASSFQNIYGVSGLLPTPIVTTYAELGPVAGFLPLFTNEGIFTVGVGGARFAVVNVLPPQAGTAIQIVSLDQNGKPNNFGETLRFTRQEAKETVARLAATRLAAVEAKVLIPEDQKAFESVKIALSEEKRRARVFQRLLTGLLSNYPDNVLRGDIEINLDRLNLENHTEVTPAFVRNIDLFKTVMGLLKQRPDGLYEEVGFTFYSQNQGLADYARAQGLAVGYSSKPQKTRITGNDDNIPENTGYAFLDYAQNDRLSPLLSLTHYSLYLLGIQNHKDSMTAADVSENAVSEVKRLAGNTPKEVELTRKHVFDFGSGNLESRNIALEYMARLMPLFKQAFTQFLAELKAVESAA